MTALSRRHSKCITIISFVCYLRFLRCLVVRVLFPWCALILAQAPRAWIITQLLRVNIRGHSKHLTCPPATSVVSTKTDNTNYCKLVKAVVDPWFLRPRGTYILAIIIQKKRKKNKRNKNEWKWNDSYWPSKMMWIYFFSFCICRFSGKFAESTVECS